MDAFFASVEQRDDPSLRGQPTLVAGRPPRGVVQAASYEARVFGCRSAMPTGEAVRLCPHARIVKGNFAKYRKASGQVFEILRDYTPLVQPLSIDEAFMDVTGSERLFGSGETIGRKIRRRVLETTGLTCSVGVAPNKFLAKLVGGLKKPDALYVIDAADILPTLGPMAIEQMWGVGPAAARKLRRFGVKTFADLREMPDDFFDRQKLGRRLRELAFGLDDRPVVPERNAKSIGHEHTFGEDIGDAEVLRDELLGQVEHVAVRLRKADRVCRSVTIKLRHGETYSRFVTLTRRTTINATSSTRLIWHAARDLFDAWASQELQPLRLLGVTLSELSEPEATPQLDLFASQETLRDAQVDRAMDAVRAKFGDDAVRRGARSPS
jgi:DNA polymerase-4